MSTFFLTWLIGLTLNIQTFNCHFPFCCCIALSVWLQLVTVPLEVFSAMKLLRLLFLVMMTL